MKSSYRLVANKAGIKHLSTWLMGARLLMSKFALPLIVDLIIFMAPLTKKPGILVCYLASSVTSTFISVKGESSTMAAMLGSLSPYMREVTAPIDLPHRPIVEAFLSFLRYSMIMPRSSLSYQPKEIYSPSELPHPAKSKQNKVMFAGSRKGTASMPSKRQLLLPCM